MTMLASGCSKLGLGANSETSVPSDTTAMTIATMATTAPTSETTEVPVETEPPVSYTEEFINYFYMNLLGREATSDELSTWVPKLEDGSMTADTLVSSIINSAEFNSMGYTNEDFVDLCYRVISMNYAGEETIKYWCSLMETGMGRSDIAKELMATDGFREMCSGYGLLPAYAVGLDYVSTPRSSVENAPGDKVISGLGGYIPGEETLLEINTALDTLGSRGWKVGFVVIDMQSNLGISYNLGQDFYTASSIKGPFATSLAAYNPEAASKWQNTIINMLVNSDNDAYTALNNTYRRTYIQQWCEECGVDPALCVYKYPHITTRDLALMWIKSYYYFEEDEFGAEIATWFENPAYSLIHSELEETCTTRTKAGWMVDDNPKHTTTVDGGIVYTDCGDYVIVIMSTVPRDIEPLRPLLQALINAHNEM